MHEKYEFPISLLIEIEHTACHDERLSCSCRHIEEEMLACTHITLLEEIYEVLHCLLLIGSEFLRRIDIIRDILRDILRSRFTISARSTYPRE